MRRAIPGGHDRADYGMVGGGDGRQPGEARAKQRSLTAASIAPGSPYVLRPRAYRDTGAIRHSEIAALLRHRSREQRRIDAPVEEVHPPVEMRPGGAAGRADLRDGLPLRHPLAGLDQDA